MSPVTKAYIRCRSGKIRLEGQRTECRISIAREADRITMASQSAPAVEDNRTSIRAVQAHIVIENMVAPKGFTKPWHTRIDEILLPVEPPEVYPLCFTMAQNVLKHHLIKRSVFQFPGYIGCRIGQMQVTNHITKIFLIAVNAIGWVQIQPYFQMAPVHKIDEFLRLWNNRLVPCPAGPSLRMPVHVEYHHVKRNIVLLDFGGNIHKILLCIALIFAVPIA